MADSWHLAVAGDVLIAYGRVDIPDWTYNEQYDVSHHLVQLHDSKPPFDCVIVKPPTPYPREDLT